MTKQSTIVRTDPLEQAIQTVIRDIRIPKDLRTALGVYQNQRADLNNHGISVVPPKSTSLTTAFRFADGCQPDNLGSCEDATQDTGVSTDLAREMDVQMWINIESLDWSVEINGYRHEHITIEVMEALIECAVIQTVSSVMRTFSARPQ
jgi:hypothetical protein